MSLRWQLLGWLCRYSKAAAFGFAKNVGSKGVCVTTHTEHNLEHHDTNCAVAYTQVEAGCCVIRLGWQAASTVPLRESKVRYYNCNIVGINVGKCS